MVQSQLYYCGVYRDCNRSSDLFNTVGKLSSYLELQGYRPLFTVNLIRNSINTFNLFRLSYIYVYNIYTYLYFYIWSLINQSLAKSCRYSQLSPQGRFNLRKGKITLIEVVNKAVMMLLNRFSQFSLNKPYNQAATLHNSCSLSHNHRSEFSS